MRVLDSHLHLWNPSRLAYDWLEGPLLARFAAEEVAAARRPEDEHAAVFVQADCAPEQFFDEVEWVASIAATTGVEGIVAGVRLDRGAETERDLDAVAQHPLVVGVRHLLQGEADGFAGDEAFRAGAQMLAERDLTFDACVRGVTQLRDVAALAADLPRLRMVLDHLGKPEVGTAGSPVAPSAEWADALRAVAAHEQVFCKLSGLPAEAGGDWSPVQLEPFFDVALSAFGEDRLMFGSDWPVSAVTSSPRGAVIDPDVIGAWADAVASWAASRDLAVDAIMWDNAARFYGLA
ncbi:amidohydrolase family protein [Microbacterium abyssi]|uniref:amidohydrolase family protein n=1 Tax=Microbacterium abyssi TaxID=2782166 RepID=UPI001889ACF4|nr:amidohydrolase family protein [Microbacterium sp. A18JL241]